MTREQLREMFPNCFKLIVITPEQVSVQLKRSAYQKKWNGNFKWRVELRATLEEHFHSVVVLAPPHPVTKQVATLADWTF